MQVAAHSASFFLACHHQSFAGALQIAGQPDGLDGDGDLPDEVLQEPPIRCAEGVSVSPGGQRESSDIVTAVGQGEVEQVSVLGGAGAVFAAVTNTW